MILALLFAVSLGTFGMHTEGTGISKLYVITVGSTDWAEKDAARFDKLLGAFALNASVWVQREDGAWYQVEFRRPMYEEIGDFLDDPLQFSGTTKIEGLPQPVRHMKAENLVDVDYIVRYYAGGTKIYLKANTSQAKAKLILLQLAPESKLLEAPRKDF